MALDTKYRPRRFEDVLGQESTTTVLQRFVQSGAGFHQSYLFCGGHGSGKTTMGRILARALLCDAPVDGNPCDQCPSCLTILESGSSDCFIEVDAATNSGKADVEEITSSLQYDTFSGKRRIYLFDEAHRMSKDALDALLKPMEDTVPGGEDKLMVCIFCTTEPEKMRTTIRSRCAPAFVIRRVSNEGIADRLATVCEKEEIPYEREALVMIAEVVEAHIRDALKAVEGVAQKGAVTVENVREFLRLNATDKYLAILLLIGRDLERLYSYTHALQEVASPATVYENLSELAMMAYRFKVGASRPPSYVNSGNVEKVIASQGEFLLRIAQFLGAKFGHPTFGMLDCDLAFLHFEKQGILVGGPSVSPPMQIALNVPPPAVDMMARATVESSAEETAPANLGVKDSSLAGKVPEPAPPPKAPMVTKGGVFIDPRAINHKRDIGSKRRTTDGRPPPLEIEEFRIGLRRLIDEMAVDGRGARSA